MLAVRKWMTQYTHGDEDYVGPIILADCIESAQAVMSVLLGPGGETLYLVGEVADQHVSVDGECTSSFVVGAIES